MTFSDYAIATFVFVISYTVHTTIGPTDTTVTHKSLNISAFLARRDTWFGMGDFFVSP